MKSLPQTEEGREILYEDRSTRITKPLHKSPSKVYQFLVWKKDRKLKRWFYRQAITDWNL